MRRQSEGALGLKSAVTTPDGKQYIRLSGSFRSPRGSRDCFELETSRVVTFHSSARNVIKAMEVGRLLRLYGVNTIQLRTAACSSACALVDKS